MSLELKYLVLKLNKQINIHKLVNELQDFIWLSVIHRKDFKWKHIAHILIDSECKKDD